MKIYTRHVCKQNKTWVFHFTVFFADFADFRRVIFSVVRSHISLYSPWLPLHVQRRALLPHWVSFCESIKHIKGKDIYADARYTTAVIALPPRENLAQKVPEQQVRQSAGLTLMIPLRDASHTISTAAQW